MLPSITENLLSGTLLLLHKQSLKRRQSTINDDWTEASVYDDEDNEDDESVEVWDEYCHDDVSEEEEWRINIELCVRVNAPEDFAFAIPGGSERYKKRAFLVKLKQKLDADGPWDDEADAQAAADTQIVTIVIWDTSKIQDGPEVMVWKRKTWPTNFK